VRILAFDTATRATSVALDGGGRRSRSEDLELRDDPPAGVRPRHTTRLMPLIVEALEATGTDWSELDRVAVGVGPGTFTGLRIGVATARALARARRIPLVAVSTLESLALNAVGGDPPYGQPDRPEAVVSVLDARRGEVFAAAWELAEPRRRLLAPGACTPGDLAERINKLAVPVLAIGEGAVEFRPVLERAGALIPADGSTLNRVTAVNHARLARTLAATDPNEIRPQYLRLPDAELTRLRTHRQ
jgi:tRNA threonylcarbamoyladenosine biosynthesis protein TsaB